jgi:hypothetical protein
VYRFIAKVPVPAQGCFRVNALLLKERSYVLRGPRLFLVESSREPKQNPAQEGSGGGREEAIEIHQKDCNENEERR